MMNKSGPVLTAVMSRVVRALDSSRFGMPGNIEFLSDAQERGRHPARSQLRPAVRQRVRRTCARQRSRLFATA